jgi:hypothetical protein
MTRTNRREQPNIEREIMNRSKTLKYYHLNRVPVYYMYYIDAISSNQTFFFV